MKVLHNIVLPDPDSVQFDWGDIIIKKLKKIFIADTMPVITNQAWIAVRISDDVIQDIEELIETVAIDSKEISLKSGTALVVLSQKLLIMPL